MKDMRDQAFPVEKPFFDGCHRGVLRLQRCMSCGHHQFYPRLMCEHCWEREPEWIEASGRGRIASFTVVRLPVSSDYEAPYVVALVELAEGPTMMSQITGCDPESVKIGDEVTVTFETIAEWQALPVFQLDT